MGRPITQKLLKHYETKNETKGIMHFGLIYSKPRKELELHKVNYARIRTEGTVVNGNLGQYVVKSDIDLALEEGKKLCIEGFTREDAKKACEEQRRNALRNYDYNKQYFRMLKSSEFKHQIEKFREAYPEFTEVKAINDYRPKNVGICSSGPYEGVYVMVLGKYKQIYVGQTKSLSTRIKEHWGVRAGNDLEHIERWDSSVLPLKKCTYYPGANEENSVLTIDAFGPLDTTQIFFYETPLDAVRKKLEAELIDFFNHKFLCNRRDEKTGKYIYRDLTVAIEKCKIKEEKRKAKQKTTTHFGVRIKDREKTTGIIRPKFEQYFSKFRELGYKSISDLNEYNETPGVYILVLDDFEKIYVGHAEKDIRKSVMGVWARRKPTGDKVVYDDLRIQDFKPIDTTKIFVKKTTDYKAEKMKLQELIRKENLLNGRIK